MLALSDDIDIDIKQVLQNIGYATDYQPSARIMSLVNEYIDNVHNIIAPSYSYVIRDVKSVKDSSVVIDGSIILESKSFQEGLVKLKIFTRDVNSILKTSKS